MKQYIVRITETAEYSLIVEAESAEAAMAKVEADVQSKGLSELGASFDDGSVDVWDAIEHDSEEVEGDDEEE